MNELNQTIVSEGKQPSLNEFINLLEANELRVLLEVINSETTTALDIQAFIKEKYQIEYSVLEIVTWKISTSNTNANVQKINLTNAEYRGINEIAELEYQIAQLHNMLLTMQAEFEFWSKYPDENDEEAIEARIKLFQQRRAMGGITLNSATGAVAALTKQQVGLIARLNQMKLIHDQTELMLAGGHIVLDTIEKAAKKLPQAKEVVEALCQAGWNELKAQAESQ